MPIVDDDTPEPIPAQVNWLDENAPITQRADLRWTCTLAARWTKCVSGFIVPNVAQGRSPCPDGSKPAVHLTRVILVSSNQATVLAERAAITQKKPRDYFTTEGRHDVDLDVGGGLSAQGGGRG